MANQELFQALNMFSSGMKELAVTTALTSASQAARDIKNSALSNEEKAQNVQLLGNELALKLVGLGAPATSIAQATSAIGPPQPKTASEMFAQGSRTGDTGMVDRAKQQQEFDTQPRLQVALARAANPYASIKQEEAKQQANVRFFKDFSKELDVTAASSRSTFGIAGKTGQAGDRLRALVGSPADIAKANDQDITLIAEGLANMVKGGVATEKEISALVPNTSGSITSRIKQFYSNNPEPADRAGFVQKYLGIIGREDENAKNYVTNTILKRASSNKKLASRDSEQFKLTIAENLRQVTGKEISPDDIDVPARGPIRLTPDAQTKLGKPVRVKDKKTGQLSDAIQGIDGKIYFPGVK